MTYQEAMNKLQRYGQEHVLAYYAQLTEEQKQALLEQIENTDFSMLSSCKEKREESKRGEISPLAAMQLTEIEAGREQFVKTGLDAIKQGKVGAVFWQEAWVPA